MIYKKANEIAVSCSEVEVPFALRQILPDQHKQVWSGQLAKSELEQPGLRQDAPKVLIRSGVQIKRSIMLLRSTASRFAGKSAYRGGHSG